jgi:transcriptional regulator with XRE-family HTH domain
LILGAVSALMVSHESQFRKCGFEVTNGHAVRDASRRDAGPSVGDTEAKVMRGGSPTIRRRELGGLLRTLRADHGLTAEEVTARLLFSPTKLSRIETGHSGASPRDIRDLCDLYQVRDPAEREHLMLLAREGKQRGWWQDYDLPYATYVGLEAEAVSINVYQSGAVPGLLQTEEYARGMLRAEAPPFSTQEVEQRVQARLTRQALLVQGDGPRYHAILDEAALHRRVGGLQVMCAQLEHIAEAAHLPNVTVQVISFETGAHPAMESIFSILDFEQPLVSDIAYVEGLVGNLYLERPTDLERYRKIFSHLRTIALNPSDSILLITRTATSYISWLDMAESSCHPPPLLSGPAIPQAS